MAGIHNMLLGSVSPTTLDYIGLAGSDPSASSFTYSSVPIGVEDVGREVFVVMRWTNTAVRTLSSATIGGVTATIATTQLNSDTFGMACFFATVPTGSTATVVANLNGAATGTYIFVYRVVNRTNPSSNQVASYGDTGPVAGRTSYSLANVVLPQNGFLLLNFTSGQAQDLVITSSALTVNADIYPASAQNRASLSRSNLGQAQQTITADIGWGGVSIGSGVRMWTFN